MTNNLTAALDAWITAALEGDPVLDSFNAARASHGLAPVAAVPTTRPHLTLINGGLHE